MKVKGVTDSYMHGYNFAILTVPFDYHDNIAQFSGKTSVDMPNLSTLNSTYTPEDS